MKRFISLFIHIISLIFILVNVYILKKNYPNINFQNFNETNTFTETEEYNNITQKKINDIFKLIDYQILYERKNETNYKTIVATSYIEDNYYDWTIQDVIDMARTYGIYIDSSLNLIEPTEENQPKNLKKELYVNLIYNKNISIESLSQNRMTEYEFCKSILTHFIEYRILKNEFYSTNTNFTYIVNYKNDTKQRKYFNNNITLNDIFNSKSFIYIANDIKEIKTNMNVDKENILDLLLLHNPLDEKCNYYFACSVNLDLPKNDTYKYVFNEYNIKTKNKYKLLYTIIISLSIFCLSFITTFIFFVSAEKRNKKSTNPILYIPTEILFFTYILLSILCIIYNPNKAPPTIYPIVNSSLLVYIKISIVYILTIIYFYILNEKYIGLCNPEPKIIISLLTTINTDLSKIFTTLPVFNYVFFFFIPIFLLLSFSLYCLYYYHTTKLNFALISAGCLIFILLLFIIFIIVINKGFIKTINKSISNEKMKSDLITNVSHDIRTPLTSIINYSNLLSEEISHENYDKNQIFHYSNILLEKSDRLKKLIEDLIFSSKASSGSLEMDFQKLDIIELTSQVVADYESKLNTKQLTIKKYLPNETFYIYADGNNIFRIYDNILDNIYKYAKENTDVEITINNIDKNIVIDFTNISKEEIKTDNLSDRFVRGDKSRNTEGYGLGLSIVCDLTKLMNGNTNIVYDRNENKFSISIIFKNYLGYK